MNGVTIASDLLLFTFNVNLRLTSMNYKYTAQDLLYLLGCKIK